MMMRQSKKHGGMPTTTLDKQGEEQYGGHNYFTYRPLSNLPTPPPSSRESSSTLHSDVQEGDPRLAKFRGKTFFFLLFSP
jgi:hypothetical protein